VIFDAYEPPVPDRLLYFIAHKLNLYGEADVDELVQEGRIAIWQLWQEVQWVRNKEAPRTSSYYAKVAQRRMQRLCFGHAATFGGFPRQGYTDALHHADLDIDDPEVFTQPSTETPFELLDRIPGSILGRLVLQQAHLR
jgi:hypothetical protein